MNQMNYKKSHSSYYMNKMNEVINWLILKGFKIHNTRYSRYKEHINAFYSVSDFSELDNSFKKLNSSFQECIEIVTIYDCFKEEKSEGFHDRLKKIINGNDFFDESLPNDQSRDYLYELLVASYFKTKGYSISFDELTDVIATKGNHKLYIECKRLKSEKALEEHFRKAGKQIKRVVNNHSYGLVFIDIYNCVSRQLKDYEYSSIMEMKYTVDSIINHFSKNNRRKIDEQLKKQIESTLGVCFTCNRPLWLYNHSPQYYRNFSIEAHEDLTDERFELLKSLLS